MNLLLSIQQDIPALELQSSPNGERLVLLSRDRSRMIEVLLDDGEFTVSSSGWHTHTEETGRVVEIVRAIVSDDLVVMTAYRGGSLRLSQLSPPTDDAWTEFITKPFAFDAPDRFELHSWSGRLDRTYRA